MSKRIKEAVAETYMDENGRLTPDLQGSYVLALAQDIIPERLRKSALDRLCTLIEKNNGCLDTGFLSTPMLLDGTEREVGSGAYSFTCPVNAVVPRVWG